MYIKTFGLEYRSRVVNNESLPMRIRSFLGCANNLKTCTAVGVDPTCYIQLTGNLKISEIDYSRVSTFWLGLF